MHIFPSQVLLQFSLHCVLKALLVFFIFPLETPGLVVFAVWYCKAIYWSVFTEWHMSLAWLLSSTCKKEQQQVKGTSFKLIKLSFISAPLGISQLCFRAFRFTLSISLSPLVVPCVYSRPWIYWLVQFQCSCFDCKMTPNKTDCKTLKCTFPVDPY